MNKKAPITKSEDKDVVVRSEGLWKSFTTGDQYTTILKDVNVDIKRGEFVILFGPSGCGKSTFLNTLMGLEYPDAGDVRFMGMGVWKLNSDDRALIRKKYIGIVYQQQNWIKSMNVLDNVALIGELLGYSKEKSKRVAREKLELVGMTHRATYQPYELSSGEQQRINLARSLVSDPYLIIADEPTGNLDVKTGVKVMDIFRDLAKEGRTILMVTHSIDALSYADRILFMIDGRIRKDIYLKDGNIDEIKKMITLDIESFINDAQIEGEANISEAPKPIQFEEVVEDNVKKLTKVWNFFKFNIAFTLAMFLLVLLYLPLSLLEKVVLKNSGLSEKLNKFIIKIFTIIEGYSSGVEDSISSWDLGEISLSHLMEKRSRTLITVFGVGIGIGFITFLLSLGFGLEGLVVNEMAEIEEMRQVIIDPTISSEVVIDEERLGLISDIDGIRDVHPLINVATTIFYGDSQTDVVAYGVDSEYLDITRSAYVHGEKFDKDNMEIVIGEEVLNMLGVEGRTLLDSELTLEFIPVGREELVIEDTDDVAGAFDDKVDYVVSGIISNTTSPVIYFSIEDAKDLGIDNYSEVLVVLTDEADMGDVRRNIETLGMETSSVMDTVSQVEDFFTYFRLGLAVIGTVAFLIAVLGMVNTLTVSLMERTREVGLLKSVGMRSEEVRKLFVTESMMIAFAGGLVGVALGIIAGLILSIVLSALSISKGGDYLGISKVPVYLIIVIVFISVLVGFLTGLYPSKRAVHMSPLDALRYE